MNADATMIVGVIGAGTMGAGIAQIAAVAGHVVRLHDAREGAAGEAIRRLGQTFDTLVGKGRMTPEAAQAARGRLVAASGLGDLADCGLVVEAIVENLKVKNDLFLALEAIVAPDAILATNTSSISVTAIGRGLAHPERLVGMHFFNPVPLMKLVEIVSGLATDATVAERLLALAARWGKTPVRARSTPGFIVNRIARPFYAEALLLLQESRATPEVIDAALRAAGFRMGPCELMDLIGHDVNFAVTSSVFEAFHYDRRFQPSIVQRELVEGGRFGRKSGQGFYRYGEGGAERDATAAASPAGALPRAAVVHGDGELAGRIAAALTAAGCVVERRAGADTGIAADGLNLWLTDGRPASQRAAADRHPATAVFDEPLAASGALAFACAPGCDDRQRQLAGALLASLGHAPVEIGDAPGLVVARTVAMLVNEAADAVQQGVCAEADADIAMKLGTNYPAGPFEWLARLGARRVVGLLDALAATAGPERYRASPWLRERVWSRASVAQEACA
ncbi:3-hydroxyacyl-CoA dehydrogenase [Derxia lacustris]|uniref:3-hydroxyacyl-CoA dehydrogenase n=1 Tax=Derxia lacustris TaxID=764842 RepID=UPI000A1770E0|nr:3-hydroxyacyl-CoA dehydrogenase [Derxia lacustris]